MLDVVAAFRAAIEGQGVTVYPGGEVPPRPSYPYVVAYASTPTAGDHSHARTSASRAWRIATMYVATSEDQGIWLAERVDTALLGTRLAVAGLNCSRLDREPGPPFRRDPDAEGAVVTTDVWRFTTTNA